MTIFYLCPDDPSPIGGVKQIYRHVEALCDANIDARVLHSVNGFRPGWFNSSAPVAWLTVSRLLRGRERISKLHPRLSRLKPTIQELLLVKGIHRVTLNDSGRERALGADDVMVFPEYHGVELSCPVFGVPTVVFNQNPHWTFQSYSLTPSEHESIYTRGLRAALVPSEHSQRYLQYAFPNLQILLTRNGADEKRFFVRGKKERRIAFMPRKLRDDLREVINILNARGSLRSWLLTPIENVSESEVAELLGRSAVYLSTSTQEGFGLPPLEAGLSGCAVVGYTGYAAAEFMLPEFCDPVLEGDILGFAQSVENVLKRYDTDTLAINARNARFADFLRARYSRDKERDGVIDAWKTILSAI